MKRPIDQKGSTPIVVLISLALLVIIAGGSFYAWNILTPKDKVMELMVKSDKESVETSFSDGLFNSYGYQLDKNTRITIEAKTTSEQGGGFPKGNVTLEKDGQKTVLLENVWTGGPGGYNFTVHRTNLPDIYLALEVSGDMGWFYRNEHYLSLNESKITFSVKDDEGYTLEVNRNGMKPAKIKLEINDQCGESEQREGKKANIADISLNAARTKAIKTPIVVDCLDPGGLGPSYDPVINLEKTGITSDFSKMYFTVKGEKYNNGKPQTVWEYKYYIDLSSPNNPKIIDNNLL